MLASYWAAFHASPNIARLTTRSRSSVVGHCFSRKNGNLERTKTVKNKSVLDIPRKCLEFKTLDWRDTRSTAWSARVDHQNLGGHLGLRVDCWVTQNGSLYWKPNRMWILWAGNCLSEGRALGERLSLERPYRECCCFIKFKNEACFVRGQI